MSTIDDKIQITVGDSDDKNISAGAPLDPPKWLDRTFLERCLQSYFNSNHLCIVNIIVKPATAKGVNFASYIYRVNVEYSDRKENLVPVSNHKKLNIIVKMALQGDFAFDVLSSCNVYEKEIEFYEKIAPAIRQTLNESNVIEQLLVETFGISSANSAMLFEDLITKGYQLAPVKPGFNMAEAQIVLSKVATFHAACAVLEEKQPNIFANFNRGFISRSTEGGIDNEFLFQLDAVIELVSSWPDFDCYIEKLHRFRGKFIEKGRELFLADPKQFNTLIHGDLWTNNMMVKYGDVSTRTASSNCDFENVIFLDFQFSCWTSPAIDLQYFMNTSLCDTLRTDHLDDLIGYYHKELATMLQRFNYGKHVPTLSDLQSQFREKSFYGFLSSCLVQPLILNENTENADFEALLLGDERSMEFKRMVCQAPKIQANLRQLIPYYDRLGVFD